MLTCMMGDTVRSKPWLGLLGNVSAVMATCAAFGFAMYLGVDFIGINLAAPFLMIGEFRFFKTLNYLWFFFWLKIAFRDEECNKTLIIHVMPFNISSLSWINYSFIFWLLFAEAIWKREKFELSREIMNFNLLDFPLHCFKVLLNWQLLLPIDMLIFGN